MSDLASIQAAFQRLRDQGIDARENFMCCGGCAAAELEGSKDVGAVYWHQQDDEGAFGWRTETEYCINCRGSGVEECSCGGEEDCVDCGGSGDADCSYCGGEGEWTEETEERESEDLRHDMFIGYGGRDDQHSAEVAGKLIAALAAEGLAVEWDGSINTRVKVLAGKEEA